MKKEGGFIYILTDPENSILYVGVTSDLPKRIWQHRNKEFEGFSKRYGLDKLVYYEQFLTILEAIQREKQLKNWHRQWKIDLINKDNSQWCDLFPTLL